MSYLANFMRALLLLSIVFFATAPAPAQAWYEFVHELICERAYQQLSPVARHLVLTLSRGGEQADVQSRFGAACTWADTARHETHRATYQYHFINVPRDDTLDLARDCAAHDCVNQAIKRYAIYLSQPQRSIEQRAEALRFLGHFVGDAHQPLHVGNAEDRGGNDIFVFWLDGKDSERLHAVWDGHIPRALGLDAQSPWPLWLSGAESQDDAEWRNTWVDAWVHESFSAGRELAYRHVDGRLIESGDRLTADYLERAAPLVKRRIRQAALRLAALIELAAQQPITAADFTAPDG